eukprot:TRINITY_DN25968_c0_g1_i1.p1 TRINITY_DN25968_c0_g1~~TRINITY_DN25968_c0_g1_i1.p1  ORF type:complete len:585 (+),score=64.44 TRINITY_DN25968_c0_g1_i1:180-1757(+)
MTAHHRCYRLRLDDLDEAALSSEEVKESQEAQEVEAQSRRVATKYDGEEHMFITDAAFTLVVDKLNKSHPEFVRNHVTTVPAQVDGYTSEYRTLVSLSKEAVPKSMGDLTMLTGDFVCPPMYEDFGSHHFLLQPLGQRWVEGKVQNFTDIGLTTSVGGVDTTWFNVLGYTLGSKNYQYTTDGGELIKLHKHWEKVGMEALPEDRGGDKRTDKFYKWSDFFECITHNFNHFAPYAQKQYQVYHDEAIQAARGKDLERALKLDAIAGHYLTDLYAAGHWRAPVKKLYEVCGPAANLNHNNYSGEVAAGGEFKTHAMKIYEAAAEKRGCSYMLDWKDLQDLNDLSAKKKFQAAYYKDCSGGAITNLQHNMDGYNGLNLKHGETSETFTCYGDESAFSELNRKCLKQAVLAVYNSMLDVIAAYDGNATSSDDPYPWIPSLSEEQPTKPIFGPCEDKSDNLCYRKHDEATYSMTLQQEESGCYSMLVEYYNTFRALKKTAEDNNLLRSSKTTAVGSHFNVTNMKKLTGLE